jgi:hypothetical protein
MSSFKGCTVGLFYNWRKYCADCLSIILIMTNILKVKCGSCG